MYQTYFFDELDNRARVELRSGVAEFLQGHKARVTLTEHTVAVAMLHCVSNCKGA